ncbi:hypothetical protein [Thalassobacillus pellis]|uniref:hypothetical protein n=1 Tax=Thalassobacillus pellis TaxID=748008 RepID=UPI00195F93CA|nr:hypothetical protein [Thalassobacillus pellis]MBM7553605.1 hypothetical protein [Thalassobacillus pellis]
MEYKFAELTEEQTRKIMELESELGHILIAYDNGRHGYATSDEKVDYYTLLHGTVEE